jgi:hypothetical protein
MVINFGFGKLKNSLAMVSSGGYCVRGLPGEYSIISGWGILKQADVGRIKGKNGEKQDAQHDHSQPEPIE